MSGTCRACGASGVLTFKTLIPEESTANKLAILELCASCREAGRR